MHLKIQFYSLLILFCICTMQAEAIEPKKSRYESFSKEKCYLNELQSKARSLKRYHFENAEAILEKINSRVSRDPDILRLKIKSSLKYKKIAAKYHPPYDKYRAGRHIKGLYINATEVNTKYQNFILAACPRTYGQVRDYLEAAFDEDVAVIVSVLQSFEAKQHRNNFWQNKVLKNIKLRDGTKVKQTANEILHKKSSGRRSPKIIESSINYGDQACTHLHYDGWKDKGPAPCTELLGLLLDRICELSPDPEVPVGINCRGGVGRTGVLAVSLYLRRKVDAELARGVDLEDISVNIPETIYAFRKIRKSIISTPAQLTQLYTILHEYYTQLS
jgi:protein tyrosine phosphatase